MSSRELAVRISAVVGAVGTFGALALLSGGEGVPVAPLVALASWFAVLLVVRPLVYERWGVRRGDWVTVILVLGPLALLAAPFLAWEHRGLDADA